MNNQINSSSTRWTKIRNWIVGLTAVLVLLPSLINAGIDIYKSLLNVPKTQSERINAELFKKYFNRTPLAMVPVPIKTKIGAIDMKLSIYEAGDIFAEYGDYSQWFPFPLQKAVSLSIISSAYAQSPLPAERADEYTQVDKLKGNKIERERYYSDGIKETYTINPNTGQIQNKTITRDIPPPSKISNLPAIQVLEFPTIDIEALKEKSKTPNPALLVPR